MKTLTLSLKKQWFDKIKSGEKTCDIYFKQNRKGRHTHNHIYNALHRQKNLGLDD